MRNSEVTLRAVIIGLALAFAVGVLGPYLSYIVQGANSVLYFTGQIAHVILFLLVGVVNVVLGSIRRQWVLQKGELLVLFIAMSLGNAVHVTIYYWVPLVSSPYYYASSENNWLKEINPHIPDWLIPHDTRAISAFFEGAEHQITGIDWSVWLEPIIAWLPLFIGLPVATVCLMVMLRRQWMDQERLIYPIMQLNLAIVQDDERGSLVKPFFRSGAMWLGLAVPMIVGTVIGLNKYFPFLGTIDLGLGMQLPLFGYVRLSFATLGFFFLIQREVAFGLWLFTVLNNIQRLIYEEIGWGLETQPVVSIWCYGPPSLVHQGMGAMIVLVLGSLWVGREHLANVFRKAFTGAADVYDGDEVVSYRVAVFGLLISVGAIAVWLWSLGIPVLGVMAFLFFQFVIYLALTRVIAEGGVAVIYTPMVAADATLTAVGTSTFGSSGLVGLIYARVMGNDLLNFTMPHVANCLKLTGEIGGKKRAIFWMMLGAIFLAFFGCLWMLLYLGSTYGAINLSNGMYVFFPNYLGDYTVARIAEPTGPYWLGWFHSGIGGFVMILLLLARRFWVWWPLHPIGFPISTTLHWIAFNAFLAWLFKGPVLRYGGVARYRAVRPFFLGLILGHFAIFGVFWIVDSLTGMTGNRLFL